MTVFTVTEYSDHDNPCIMGIFSSEEKAEEFCYERQPCCSCEEEHDSSYRGGCDAGYWYDIEEWELDKKGW